MAESGKIDLGIVILPHDFHGWGMQVLLEAGLHVIVEKPFATRVEDCDAAIALAREKGGNAPGVSQPALGPGYFDLEACG